MIVTFLFLHKHISTDILAHRKPTDAQTAECYTASPPMHRWRNATSVASLGGPITHLTIAMYQIPV